MFMNLVSIHQSYSYSLMMLREIERHTDNTQVKKEAVSMVEDWNKQMPQVVKDAKNQLDQECQ
jgi:hypothetical protein